MNDVINLDKLDGRYIDLDQYAENVDVVGKWKGDRLVFKGKKPTKLVLDHCTIETTRTEADKNAIAFAEDVDGLEILGVGCTIVGGIAFWKGIKNTTIQSLNIYYPNIGIHAAKDFEVRNFTIRDCKVVGAQREGIYIGPHTPRKTPANNILIFNNKFHWCGWDPAQANGQNVTIKDNLFDNCCTLKEKNQDWAITIQPGSLAFIENNRFLNTPNNIQILDSRGFVRNNTYC